MHTVELLERAIQFAERLGYRIRQEWLGGTGGGGCEFGGQKWIFIDLASDAVEQLQQVTDALRADQSLQLFDVPQPLQRLLDVRKVA
jgi:hypothetical protein